MGKKEQKANLVEDFLLFGKLVSQWATQVSAALYEAVVALLDAFDVVFGGTQESPRFIDMTQELEGVDPVAFCVFLADFVPRPLPFHIHIMFNEFDAQLVEKLRDVFSSRGLELMKIETNKYRVVEQDRGDL